MRVIILSSGSSSSSIDILSSTTRPVPEARPRYTLENVEGTNHYSTVLYWQRTEHGGNHGTLFHLYPYRHYLPPTNQLRTIKGATKSTMTHVTRAAQQKRDQPATNHMRAPPKQSYDQRIQIKPTIQSFDGGGWGPNHGCPRALASTSKRSQPKNASQGLSSTRIVIHGAPNAPLRRCV